MPSLVLFDTNALLFDAIFPKRLTARARTAIEEGNAGGTLACSDISLWEIAMLISKERVQVGSSTDVFLRAIVAARSIQILPITPEIAALSQTLRELGQSDPADHLIAATAIHHHAPLITSDRALRRHKALVTIW